MITTTRPPLDRNSTSIALITDLAASPIDSLRDTYASLAECATDPTDRDEIIQTFAEMIIDDCRDDDTISDALALHDDDRAAAFIDTLRTDYEFILNCLMTALTDLLP